MHIFGASGHAKVIIESLLSSGVTINAVYDDDLALKSILGIEINGALTSEKINQIDQLIIAIGSNDIRKKIANSFNVQYGNAIHVSAVISPSALLGVGIAVMANAVINAECKIGNHCIINTNTSVDHDCIIEDFVHIAPNTTLTGGIKVKEGAFVGAGAVILPGITIGEWAVIGAGAVVVNDVQPNTKVVGNPAKEI